MGGYFSFPTDAQFAYGNSRLSENNLLVLSFLLTPTCMARDSNDSATSLGFVIVESSESARVALSKQAKKEYDGLEAQPRGRLKRIFQRWCKGQSLTEEMINPNEGRTSKHNEMIQAFKVRRVRLYGFVRSTDGMRTFFVLDADSAKKQNKAGPILGRAKKRADQALDNLIRIEKD